MPDYDITCVHRNFAARERALKDNIALTRLNILKNFIKGFEKTISIGCGGYEAVFIGSSEASDINPAAEEYIKKLGFTGKFTEASCFDLPFEDQAFEAAVCSEVIEHLKNTSDVIDTFKEMTRISKAWLITTPCKEIFDPDHNFLFTEESLKSLLYEAGMIKTSFIYKKIPFFYITNKKIKV